MPISSDTLRPETLAELESSLDQMKTANYFLRVALDQVTEGVLMIEAEASSNTGPKVLFSNAAAAILVGVEPDKGLRGMSLADLAVGDLDARTLLQSLNLAVENGGTHECECRIQNFYGREPERCIWRVRAVLADILRGQLGFTGAVFSDDLSMAGARVIDGQSVSTTEAAVAALNAGCDLVLLCNQSLGDGAEVDALINGLTEAQLKGGWQPLDASEERRLALLPRSRATAWDELMVQPAYMQALDFLP